MFNLFTTPPLKEAHLHIPTHFNDGAQIPSNTLAAIEGELITTFGGYTRTSANGAWHDTTSGHTYRDNMLRYTIACNKHDMKILASLCKKYCHMLKQECIYMIDINGKVDFIEL